MNKLNLVKNFKAYTLRMKDRRKQNIALLKSYFKQQRLTIVKNTQKRMIRLVLWTGLISISYYFAHNIYSQKLEVQQMQRKLKKLYPSIVTKVPTQNEHEIYYVIPQYDDQLANIVEMCWKYHYKIIIKSDRISKQQLKTQIEKFIKDIPEKVTEKCLIINLSKLRNLQIDDVNSTVKVESGITCKQLNEKLNQRGYASIFPEQIALKINQTVYDAVSNNYPTQNGPISNFLINLDLISAQGHYFRSSNQNNHYGATPNLNNIFIGTQGAFGIPIRSKFKITPIIKQKTQKKCYQLDSLDLNQKLLMTRKIREFCQKYNNIFNVSLKSQDKELTLNIQSQRVNQNVLNDLLNGLVKSVSDLKEKQGSISEGSKNKFDIYFDTNQVGFERFLLFRHQYNNDKLNFQYSKNLLKVVCPQNDLILPLISELSSQNAVIAWTKDKQFLREIKKTIDESQVGSELMKILVQIREGIDHKKIYYSHNRYEEYFAKGTFRKLTQIFW